MELNEQDLREGLEYIVGTWEPDYLVSFFSNNLEHIPASEFKSDDGRDFTALKFRFFEDHTMTLFEGNQEFKGTWEQTALYDYHYHLEAYDQIPDGPFKDSAENLSVSDCRLVFSIGFLAIALQKTEEGFVTKEPDIGDLEQTDEDRSHKEIVGRYAVAKTIASVGDNFGLFSLEEVTADLDRRRAAGEIDQDEYDESMQMFSFVVEFTDDGQVIEWSPLPKGVSQKEIDEALAAGEIKCVRDGFFSTNSRPWKYVKGAFYYDTQETRELFDKPVSPWDELKFDEDGYLVYGSGMMLLKRI